MSTAEIPATPTPTPTFAIVGAVNHGKSSVVSTLAENDQVRISAMPGETVENQRFELRDLFVFYDTPGFQNAFAALTQLAPAAQAAEPLAVFREFLERQRGQPAFDAECRLLQPIVEGAGILYVVDGSEPVLDFHVAEMEILRLTGQPRLAIINRTSADDHVADWKRRLALHFNAVREFNAHHATFADRVELLETLAGIELAWKPKLLGAITLLREEWAGRLEEGAEIIVELLIDALTHREIADEPPTSHPGQAASPTATAHLAEDLKSRFRQAIRERETRAHRGLIQLFGHRRVRPDDSDAPVFDSDLFSEDTWRLFGLDTRQLITAGAVGGAAAGAGIDVLTAGHTLLAGALIGGVVGAASALAVGTRQPELKVTLPGLGQRFRVGGRALRVGPYSAVNFPWILLDRALGVFAYVVHRAHARRDEAVLRSTVLQSVMESAGLSTARWEDGRRRSCEHVFGQVRRGKLNPEDRRTLREEVRAQLEILASTRLPVA